MPDHNKQHRPRLDRAKVLAEAISLADAEGLDALSMRALATRMGVVPMALYKHVADKDDLIGGMVDAVLRYVAADEVPPALAVEMAREAVPSATLEGFLFTPCVLRMLRVAEYMITSPLH